MLLTDPVFLAAVGLFVAYAIGGIMHILIDYVHGKKLLRTYWDATDEKIAAIKDDVIEGLKEELPTPPPIPPFPTIPPPPDLAAFKAELLAELPTPDVRGDLEAFLRSEAGVSWARELADLAAHNFWEAWMKKGTDEKGINARKQQASAESIILNNIRFGDKRLDALWIMADDDTKRRAVHNIARVINRAGFILVPTGELPGAMPDPPAIGPPEL